MNIQKPNSKSGCDILIVDNGTNHLLFGQLAQYLQQTCGLKIVYLTLIPARVDYFRSLGIDAQVLDLSAPCDADVVVGEKLILSIEDRFPHYRFGLSIKRDRILRWFPRSKAERLLMAAAVRYEAILDSVQPRVVLGEISWAIEHLFFHLSEARGIVYRHILNLPGKELLVTPFDADHSAKGTGYLGEASAPESGSTGKSYYELCGAVKGYKPSLGYFASNFKMLYSANDYRQSLFYRIRRIVLPVYRLLQQLFEAWYAKPLPEDKKHLLMVLHVQPESTPDYVAPFYSNQIALAQTVADSLKHGQYLYVKDHPNVVSMRNLIGWARLLRQGKVRLLKRSLPGRELMSKFPIVVSIAGTALYECSRLGIPAISMSDVFMNELSNVIDGRRYVTFSDAIVAAEQLKVTPLTEDEAQAFLARFGVPAFIHDARIAPDVVNIANIQRLADVVLRLLSQVGH